MQTTFSIFPKFYKHLSLPQLAVLVREAGLDTTNLVIREGYWATLADLPVSAPSFAKAMAAEGLTVSFSTAGFEFGDIIADDTPLRVLADCGIRDFRPAYFRADWSDPTDTVRAARRTARATMEKVAEACLRTGTRCVYQLHHRTLFPSPSSIWPIIRDLPAEAVGVMLDPGNQAFEGFEDWQRSCELLGEYVAAAGIKDVVVERDGTHRDAGDKGWRRRMAPCYEGITNWH